VFHKLHFPETFDPKYVLPFFNGIFLCSPNWTKIYLCLRFKI
jgi:hypothetical protein